MTINIYYKTTYTKSRWFGTHWGLQQIRNYTYQFTFTGSMKWICYFVIAAVKEESESSSLHVLYTK